MIFTGSTWRRFASLWVLLLFVGVASAADAKKKPKVKKKPVALFPIVNKDAPQDIINSVGGLLEKASLMVEQVQVVSGAKLKKATKIDPGKAMAGCGANLKCIAKLGKKAKAEEVLMGRASASEAGGASIMFIAINVKTQGLDRKVTLEFPNVDAVKQVLGGAFYELFGLTTPGSLTVTGASGQVRIDGEYAGSGPGPYEVKPGRHEISTSGMSATVTIAPGATKKLDISEMTDTAGAAVAEAPATPPPPGAASEEDDLLADAGKGATPAAAPVGTTAAAAAPPAAGEEDPLALVDPASGADVPGTATASETPSEPVAAAEVPPPAASETPLPPPAVESEGGSSALLWAGVAVAVAGAGALAGGIVVGSGADATKGSRDGLTQLQAQKRNKDAQSTATLGTILSIAGGVVLAAGATLVAVDLFSSSETETRVTVSPAGAGAVLTVRW